MAARDVELVGEAISAFQEGMERGEFGLGFERGLLAEHAEWVPAPELPDPAPARGREEMAAFMRTWSEDFDDWSIEVDRMIEAGDGCVVVLMRQSATGHESGVPVELEFAQVWDLRDGQVVRIRNFLERDRAFAEAELEPDPG